MVSYFLSLGIIRGSLFFTKVLIYIVIDYFFEEWSVSIDFENSHVKWLIWLPNTRIITSIMSISMYPTQILTICIMSSDNIIFTVLFTSIGEICPSVKIVIFFHGVGKKNELYYLLDSAGQATFLLSGSAWYLS